LLVIRNLSCREPRQAGYIRALLLTGRQTVIITNNLLMLAGLFTAPPPPPAGCFTVIGVLLIAHKSFWPAAWLIFAFSAIALIGVSPEHGD
jgi:hypothetical protein